MVSCNHVRRQCSDSELAGKVISPGAPEKASPLFIGLYALAYASLWLALLTPVIITLALRVRELAPEDSARPISWILVAGAFVALVSNPVFGSLSDRTRSRFGGRRPWLIGGMTAGCAALALVGLAQSISAVLAAWCLAQLAYNAALASMVAIVPDRIPAHQRGTVVGILGVCVPIGQIGGTYLVRLLAPHLLLSFLVPALIGLAGVTLLAVYLGKDAGVASPSAKPREDAPRPRGHRDFSWTWLSRVFFTTGSSFLQAYQPFFLLDTLGISASRVPGLVFRSTLVSSVMVVVWSLVSGRLSDRTGLRKPFVMAGSAVQGLGLFVVAAADSYGMLLAGVALVGMGQGMYNGVDLALVTEVLPDRAQHAAKDLGLLNIANTLPQVVAPLAAPALLQLSDGHYSPMFVAAGLIAWLGSMALIPIRSVR